MDFERGLTAQVQRHSSPSGPTFFLLVTRQVYQHPRGCPQACFSQTFKQVLRDRYSRQICVGWAAVEMSGFVFCPPEQDWSVGWCQPRASRQPPAPDTSGRKGLVLVEVEREATVPWFSEALEIVVRGQGLWGCLGGSVSYVCLTWAQVMVSVLSGESACPSRPLPPQ